jgi:16S rRNA (uracil1498-N3)-methyltransferase
VPGPWQGRIIEVPPGQRHHVENVLRRKPGSDVSYTDGAGLCGEGTWTAAGIERGDEISVPEPPSSLTLAVAPPDSKERIRWLVEKCTELGVARIRWIRTQLGQGRPPQPDKAHAWMQSALEQSRRAHVTVVDSGWSTLDDLGDFAAADQSGRSFRPLGSITLAIGPEGGWAPSELPPTTYLVTLAPSLLRTETAAVSAAALFGALTDEGFEQ